MTSPALIPYGRLADGKQGILVNNATGKPLAGVVEILAGLPSTGDTGNFEGRMVYDTVTVKLYQFRLGSPNFWKSLEGVPAIVSAVAGNPPVSPVPDDGLMLYDTDTEVLFLWDGTAWIPVGGSVAAQIYSATATGNGVTSSYSLGSGAAGVTVDEVEVFLDGVRQLPTVDYTVTGTNVTMVTTPPSGTNVFVRALIPTKVAENAQVFTRSFTAVGGETQVDIGVPTVDPNSLMVFRGGRIKVEGIDYTLTQANTQILSITRSGTTATVTTAVAHGLANGQPVSVYGTTSPYFNITATISGVTTTTFQYTVSGSAPSSASGNPTMYFWPAATNARITLSPAATAGEVIVVKSFKNAILGAVSSAYSYEVRNSASVSPFAVSTESYVGVKTVPMTVNLPAASIGRRIKVVDETGSASGGSPITVTPAGLATVNGGAVGANTLTSAYNAKEFVSDGTNWFVSSST